MCINIHQPTWSMDICPYQPSSYLKKNIYVYNIYHIFIIDTHIPGWWFQPLLWKIWVKVSWDDEIPNWMENKMFKTTNQIYTQKCHIWYVYIPDGKTTHTLRANLTISPFYRISHILMISTTSLSIINTRNQFGLLIYIIIYYNHHHQTHTYIYIHHHHTHTHI